MYKNNSYRFTLLLIFEGNKFKKLNDFQAVTQGWKQMQNPNLRCFTRN